MAYGNGLWAVVMSTGSDYGMQTWQTSYEYPDAFITEKWDEGYRISNLAYGNGLWAVVMSKGINYYWQTWQTSYEYPQDYITEKWDTGYHITDLTYGNGLWAVVMSSKTEPFADLIPPSAPVVIGNNNLDDNITINWIWVSGGGGNGTYRYKLDDNNLTSNAEETISTSFSPSYTLPEGPHTLYVQEKDNAGNWSDSGSFTIVIDVNSSSVSVYDQPDLSLALYLDEGQEAKSKYEIGDTINLIANFRDKNGEDYNYTLFSNWVSSAPNIAEVTEGFVTFKKEGEVKLLASFQGFMASLDFIVGEGIVENHHGNLIIIAGGDQDNTQDQIKNAVQYLSDRMYQVFKARGFEDDEIYYINHESFKDFNGDGNTDNIVDQTQKTTASLQTAISWAMDQSNDGPLYIYLVDHGEKNGTFLLDGKQILTASQLDAMLDGFEDQTGRNSIIILEACYSGSFMNILKDNDRIVFTSSAASKYSFLNDAGDVSFSQFLSNYFLVGKNWEDAFDLAVTALEGMGKPYSTMEPQKEIGLDITVNKIYGDFSMASFFPKIESYTKGNAIDVNIQQTFTIKLDMLDIKDASVWALVTPPNYQPPTVTQEYTVPALGLDNFTFTNVAGTKEFAGNYTFPCNGIYKIVYYVKDSSGNVISVPPQEFTASGGENCGYPIGIASTWNLISLPVIPDDSSVDAILSGIKDNVVSVWKWGGNTWAVCLPNEADQGAVYAASKGFGLLDKINAGEGFWINSTVSQNLMVSGTQPADTSLSLTSGWNLIGLKNNQSQAIIDLLSSQESKVLSVWKWESGKWAVYLPGENDGGADYAQSKGFTVLSNINPGEGFWVNCTQAVDLQKFFYKEKSCQTGVKYGVK